ncbi:MAG: tyrosine-protein phosphatase [Defluviitaleaceae bacterium]|nr:tyrosine-protein phosphatase [Defluviitaleaceae bacterium]
MKNFRDLGGIKTADGKALRYGRLLRSEQPVGLSSCMLKKLQECNLRHIIDFRTAQEVAACPVDKIEGVTYMHIDIMGDNSAQAADPVYWLKIFVDNPRLGVGQQFVKTYTEFVTSKSSMRGYSTFVKECAKPRDGAILFHCTMGKDRTGFAAAILLKILGVSAEAIFEDYLKSVEYSNHMHEVYAKKDRKRIEKYGMCEEQINAFREAFCMKREYLQAAFDVAEGMFGGFEGYVREGLGVSEGEVAGLKRGLLE